MQDRDYIFFAIVFTLFFALLGTDAILTAKERAFEACVKANRAATPSELKTICGE